MNRTIIRNAVAGTTLVASAALAAPAVACLPTEAGTTTASSRTTSAAWAASDAKPGVKDAGRTAATRAKDPKATAPKAKDAKGSTLTFAEKQAKVLDRIDARLAGLKALRAKVAGSERLTSEQRSARLARIDAATAALSGLRSDVAADTTTAQLKDDLKAFASAHRGDVRSFGAGHHQWSQHHEGKATAGRSGDARQAGSHVARHRGDSHRHDNGAGSRHG